MNTLANLTPDIQKIVDQHKRHLDICKKWKKENPEKNCAYSNKYYKQMKEEDPIKYREYLDKQNAYYNEFKTTPEQVIKRKEYYQNVIKPREALKKLQSETIII